MAVGAKDFNVGSVPIVSRLWQKVDERTIGRNINERYYHAVDEAETTADRLGQYKKKARLGSIEYADASIDFKRLKREKRITRLNAAKGYQEAISTLQSELKNIDDKTDAEAVSQAILTVKAQMLETLESEEAAGYPDRRETYDYMPRDMQRALRPVERSLNRLSSLRRKNDSGRYNPAIERAEERFIDNVETFNQKMGK